MNFRRAILILRVPTRDISFVTYASFNRMEASRPFAVGTALRWSSPIKVVHV